MENEKKFSFWVENEKKTFSIRKSSHFWVRLKMRKSSFFLLKKKKKFSFLVENEKKVLIFASK